MFFDLMWNLVDVLLMPFVQLLPTTAGEPYPSPLSLIRLIAFWNTFLPLGEILIIVFLYLAGLIPMITLNLAVKLYSLIPFNG